MRNLLIILLTVLVVIAGTFLPEYLLKHNAGPEVNMDYQLVSITSQSSSDYAWRMERIAEHYFGEGEHLLTTYISEVVPDEEDTELDLLRQELNKLIEMGAVHPAVGEVLAVRLCRIRYYYLFDSEAVSGFRIAELSDSGTNWSVSLCLDVESGKLAAVRYGGTHFFPGTTPTPNGTSGWYDMLRPYADYLGLGAAVTASNPDLSEQPARRYYEDCTADRLTARLSGTAWLEVRALKETSRLSLCVYSGGK